MAIEIEYDDKRKGVTIFIPYTEGSYSDFGLSSSGKSYLIATRSFASINKCPDDLMVSFNLLKSIKRKTPSTAT